MEHQSVSGGWWCIFFTFVGASLPAAGSDINVLKAPGISSSTNGGGGGVSSPYGRGNVN